VSGASPDAVSGGAGAIPADGGAVPATSPQEDAGSPLELSADEATAVMEAAAAFARALPPGRDGPYRALVAGAARGTIQPEHVAALEKVCTLALETGKARQIGRAEAERLLSAVLCRTPRGKAMLAEVAGVNRALSQLSGRQLESARLSQRIPGHYELSLSVSGIGLTLEITHEAVTIRSLSAG